MPTRVVRGEIVHSESLANVSLLAGLLFRNLIALADDYGRYHGSPAIIAAHAYPLRRDVTAEHVAGWLDELANADGEGVGPIHIYEVGGKRYVALVNWEEHRGKSRRGSASRFPQPPVSTCEDGSTASAEIRGEPRGSEDPRDFRGDPPEESGSRGVEESGKDIQRAPARRTPVCDCPLELDLEARNRIAAWAAERPKPIPRSDLGPAWERFRDWAHGKGERKRNWEAAFRNALAAGWVLESKSPAQAKVDRTIEAARAAVEALERNESELAKSFGALSAGRKLTLVSEVRR